MRNANPHRNLRLGALFALGISVTLSLSSLAMSSPKPEPQGAKKPAGFSVTLPNSVAKINMVPIPGGSVTVGGKSVTVKPFYMATTEIPWEVYDVFLASGPPSKPYDQTKFGPDAIARPSKSYILPDLGWGHRGYPAINLSSDSVEMFCRWLSSVTGKKYRLPTEAEWELAARGGVNGPWKMDAASLDKISWNASNSKETTHPVGKKAPNKYGLFDMLGNTGEWAKDMNGKPVLCGPSFRDKPNAISPTIRRRFVPSWQETDPQMPKSRWWLADAPFCGFRIVTVG